MAPSGAAASSSARQPEGGWSDCSATLLPSSLLREIVVRVRTSTTPPGLYDTQKTTQACALVCRDWCACVLAEARTLRVQSGTAAARDGEGAGLFRWRDPSAPPPTPPSSCSSLTARSMERLSGLRLVEVLGDAPEEDDDDDSQDEDTALTPQFLREGRAWRQVGTLELRGAPRRLGRLLSAVVEAEAAAAAAASAAAGPAPGPPLSASMSFLPSLAVITATALPPPLVAQLARCLTRERLPVLAELALTLAEGCLSPLDWPHGGGDQEDEKEEKTPCPPPITELSVLGPPILLGPPAPLAATPEEDARLNLEACATVTPALLRALAPTLRSLTLAVSPSPQAAVLVGERALDMPSFGLFAFGPPPTPRRRQLVPLEALAPFFLRQKPAEEQEGGGHGDGDGDCGDGDGDGAAPIPLLPRLSRLVLVGDVDLALPDPDAPVPSPAPLPGAGAAAFAQLQAQALPLDEGGGGGGGLEGLPAAPPEDWLLRFESRARRFYASGRYAYARRQQRQQQQQQQQQQRTADCFQAVIGALAPSLESLSLLPSLGDRGAEGEGGEDDGAGAQLPPRLSADARTPVLLGPEPGLEPRGRLRAWLPECLAGLTRLAELELGYGSIDLTRPAPRSMGLTVSRASTGRVPPSLRRLALGGRHGARGGYGCPGVLPHSSAVAPAALLEGDAFAALPPALEELSLLLPLERPALPRCLLDGRMPGLKRLDVSAAAAKGDAALLSALALRGRVEVTVGGQDWDAWYGSMRYEQRGDDDDGGADDGAGSGWSGDGDHWAVDYAVDSDEDEL